MAIVSVLVGYSTEVTYGACAYVVPCFKRVCLSWVFCIELIGTLRSLK